MYSLLDNAEYFLSGKLKKNVIDPSYLNEYVSSEQKKLDVLHYTLKFNLDTKNKILSGDVLIKCVQSGNPERKIDLNFYDNFNIKSVTVNGVKANYKNEDTRLSISQGNAVSDTFNIEITYSGTPKSLGFGSFTFGEYNNKPVVYSLSEPVFASSWFPCNDRPDDKALADVYITNDSASVSVSNGILVNVETKGTKRTYHWHTVYPLSTYSIAIYSAQYKSFGETYTSITGAKMPLRFYAFPSQLEDAKRDFEDHVSYLKVFEKLFGEYPFIKEKYGVAEFLWQSGAMEHQTITGIGSNFVTGKKFFSDMLIHELAHQWWGNAVGPKTWEDIWLNEGFATYSEALYWEVESGRSALVSSLGSKAGDFEKGTLYNPSANIFSRLVYDKGAWVLHMLRREVGDTVFFNILRNYYNTYKYKNASTDDFKNICEKISGKNLNYFFDQWVYKGTGIPIIDFEWSKKKNAEGKYLITMTLKQKQDGFKNYHFPLDVEFTADMGKKTARTSFYISKVSDTLKTVVDFEPAAVILDPDSWLLSRIMQSEKISEK